MQTQDPIKNFWYYWPKEHEEGEASNKEEESKFSSEDEESEWLAEEKELYTQLEMDLEYFS